MGQLEELVRGGLVVLLQEEIEIEHGLGREPIGRFRVLAGPVVVPGEMVDFLQTLLEAVKAIIEQLAPSLVSLKSKTPGRMRWQPAQLYLSMICRP